MASAVELEPAPAITGTRFLAVLMHSSMTCLCSSWLSVGLSPVVPTGTSPCVPSAICHSTSCWNALSSTCPPLKGVINAVNEPLNMGCSRARGSRSIGDAPRFVLNAARHLDSFLQVRRNKRNRKNARAALKNQYAGGGTVGQGELQACAPVM